MDKTKLLSENLDLSVSRRSFMKGTAALGAMAAMYGCAKDDDPVFDGNTNGGSVPGGDDEYLVDNPVYRWGSSTHNCGGRCIIKAQVVNKNRIVRFLTDDTIKAYDGSSTEPEDMNSTQARACSRCRSYKGRLYHPGRLKYPLKQTKERGDVTGFKRITWKEALEEITARLKAVQKKYGAESFHSIYACGNIASQYQGGGYTGCFGVNDFGPISPALRLLGGAAAYTTDYSYHQASYMGFYGTAFSGNIDMAPTTNFLADKASGIKHMVLWGTNTASTRNPKAFALVKAMDAMKENGGEIKYIGPEFSELAISQATEWIQIRPYTDTALVLGILHHMLTLTFDTTGKILDTGLDVDYLDTMVYGFFETPEYWRKADGSISLSNPSDPKAYHVAKIPEGQSFAQYILGNDQRLTKAEFKAGKSYMAKQFNTRKRSTSSTGFNSLNGSDASNSTYKYKQEMGQAKSPAWASKITGIPEQTIKDLAVFYLQCAKEGTPVWNEWAGGQLKQYGGCYTLFAIQALNIISKNWGITGTGISSYRIGVQKKTDPNEIAGFAPDSWSDPKQIPPMGPHPKISVQAWHNAVKFAFSKELKKNGYKPNIPDWHKQIGGHTVYSATETLPVYFDDGGVKSLVNREGITGVGKMNPGTFTVTSANATMPDGTRKNITYTYYNFKDSGITNGTNHTAFQDKTRDLSEKGVTGFRFILNTAGNIPMNQHANPIDSARMYKALPTFGYGKNQVAMEEAFYLVTFDNFMSPSARWSDYVLPAQTTWEQADFVGIENSGNLYIDSIKPAPGEAKSSWGFARDLVEAYQKGNAAKFVGGATINGKPATEVEFHDVVKHKFENVITKDANSPFRGKTWEQFLEKPISHAKPVNDSGLVKETHPIRKAYEDYAKSANFGTKGFNPKVLTVDWSNESGVFGFCNDPYDTGIHGFAETDTCPKQTGLFQVYSNALVWRYENLYSKWHGYLPKERQGQTNKDHENDPIVWPFPLYINYEDYFRIAYGLDSHEALKGRFLLTTTHDRFRAHSSHAENPYLRELTHSIKDGKLYSGNDYRYYAVPERNKGVINRLIPFPFDNTGENGNKEYNYGTLNQVVSYPAINQLIDNNGMPKVGYEKQASYADLWVNDEDFANFEDGTLVKVSNEIGAVVCVIRKTSRCVPGYVGLHHGLWFDGRGDINSSNVIDVGGCCNTLMPSTPSYVDHGNGTQAAMVKIERYNG